MRVNLDSNSVVASWWDYGYWITTIANKTTLADNGTINSTQIGLLGKMFMSNETEALKFLQDYDVTHVVVFSTFGTKDGTSLYDAGYGDEGKWRWMARIGGLEDYNYGNYTLGLDWVDTNDDQSVGDDELIPNELGQSTVLYKLMHYGSDKAVLGSSEIVLENFVEAYFSKQEGDVDWYGDAEGYFDAIVCVYEVDYQ
jgi:asparagine N-glycosylation enzyme membrane subunit Stt3